MKNRKMRCISDGEVVMEYVQVHIDDEDKIKRLVHNGWTPTDNLSGTHHSSYVMFSRPMRSYSQTLPGQMKSVEIEKS